MRPYRAGLGIISLGLLTFGAMFTLLQVTRSEAMPGQSAPAPTVVERAATSLAPHMAPGEIAVGVPIAGSEPLFHDVQPGDRVDVLASLTAPDNGRPVTAVVVRGATVLRPPGSTDPLLLEVEPPDAIVLAHLVLGGTHLGYAVWPAGGSPPPPQAVDETTARALLGLPPLPDPAQPVATPAATPTTIVTISTPTPVPTVQVSPTPSPPIGGFIYQAQPGDTWDGVARTFNMTPAELRQWNEASPDTELAVGTLLFVPRR